MKFQNALAFEKHLADAYPDHLACAYLVVSPADFERQKWFEQIRHVLERKKHFMETKTYDASSCPLGPILETLHSYSLFGGDSLLCIDRIDQLKKGACDALARYLEQPSQSVALVLGGSSSKGLADLIQKGKKQLVILDMSEEKPWDRKSRLKQWLVRQAAASDKKLSVAVVEYLLDEVGPDMQNLHRELEKLISFAGDKREIERNDVLAVGSSFKADTPWHAAEALVWGEDSGCLRNDTYDLSFMLAMVGQIRSQLQTGLQLAVLTKEEKPLRESIQTYPHLMKVRQIEKLALAASRKGTAFFEGALRALFDLELSLKNGAHAPDLMLQIFVAKLSRLRPQRQVRQ